jgi:hypothetical protein
MFFSILRIPSLQERPDHKLEGSHEFQWCFSGFLWNVFLFDDEGYVIPLWTFFFSFSESAYHPM